jgi:hypothetical protein
LFDSDCDQPSMNGINQSPRYGQTEMAASGWRAHDPRGFDQPKWRGLA